jgi:hypothetical protein
MSTNLDEVIGMCRFCTKPLGESPPPACAECVGLEARRTTTRLKETDPYKKVWNAVEDEEAVLLSWVRNGTLFVPTLEELARRHVSTAKYHLNKARIHGRSAEGLAAFEEALIQRKLAKVMLDRHQEVLVKSR